MTLFQEVTGWLYAQQYKHELGEGYVEKTINQMTNFELLQAISDALGSISNDDTDQ
jgi:uncharacterized protein YpiB (UPF0302 family)